MKSKLSARWVVVAIAAAMLAGLTGCEDSARQPVAAYHPPPPSNASAPPQHTAFQFIADEQLPLDVPAQALPVLSAAPPSGIERLTEQVQAVYEQGHQDRQAGRLPRAQQEFDLAYRLLLESGFDLPSDSPLMALRDEIVAASNPPARGSNAASGQEEAAAPGEPAAAAPAPAAPSPMDEIAEMAAAPEENPSAPDLTLLHSAEGELQEISHDLPLTVNDVVVSYLNFFQTARGRAIVETGLRRAGRYRNMIEEVLREEGLPSDLMYIAQAESAFQPQALSRAGARGLWQFMSYRGKQYGLQHTAWVDDRQDPEKATHAAAQHLRDLYGMFGDWYLVLAAYNSGPGTVQHAVERTGYADFWELYRLNVLPKETKDYVPIILALTLIAKDPALYGIEVQPEDPIQTDDVVPEHPLSLQLVAEALDVDLENLQALNPQLLRLATPADPSFVLHLPAGTADRFSAEMSAIPPDKWLSWREHRVAEGETLAGIARTYRVSAQAIAEVNDLTEYFTAGAPRIQLEPGTKLIIPVPEQSSTILGKRLRYRTRQGDTLASVADEFDVSVADLKKWNRLRSDHLAGGMRLTIYPAGTTPITAGKKSEQVSPGASQPVSQPVSREASSRTSAPATPNGQRIVHRVQPGETLSSIAHAYMTTVEALRAGNRFLFSRPLQAGDALIIYVQR